ncbi:hypothetical protein QTP86_007741 [Hemibagrus guttatus]|nr:hypothetical protein QTP86_007741 [Hemibagrus guttatus]
MHISPFPCTPPLRITAIDSQSIDGGYLTRQTVLLELRVGLFHCEMLAFYVTSSPANPIILGFSWLRQHDPQISWTKGELLRWSPQCTDRCFRGSTPRPCLTAAMASTKETAAACIPWQYVDFSGVFSKERSSRLPAHRPWDCAIDLLPNTSPSKNRVYPLSLPETEAMESYIEEALAMAHIHPSTSPAAAGFFFVGKKTGGFDLTSITRDSTPSQSPYPLPWCQWC